jgi:hypothetical protein
MVLTEGPIYTLLATSGSAEKSSKMNFATEPLEQSKRALNENPMDGHFRRLS